MEESLADRVRFELRDYRDWDRPVDRVLSVAMFEAVGLAHYRRFFEVVRRSLKEDGVALVHSIGRFKGPGSTNAWLAKYIFPGGYLPPSPRSSRRSSAPVSSSPTSRFCAGTMRGRWHTGANALPQTATLLLHSMTSASAGCSSSTWQAANWLFAAADT